MFLRQRWVQTVLIVGALAVLFIAPRVDSQTGGMYDLSWNTINGGGASFAQGGDYALGNSIGMPDAGTMSAGQYTLNGGFWNGAAEQPTPTPPSPTPTTNRNVYIPLTNR